MNLPSHFYLNTLLLHADLISCFRMLLAGKPEHVSRGNEPATVLLRVHPGTLIPRQLRVTRRRGGS
jgi:hypothetical protein